MAGASGVDWSMNLVPNLEATLATIKGVQDAVDERAQEVLTIAKELCPVDTGALQSSGRIERGQDANGTYTANVVFGGGAVDYACVFGSNTRVQTDAGAKRIADVKIGDRVLTQTGEFREVLATPRRLASTKPDLVDLVVRWREDKAHRLTLTTDHKVLVHDVRAHWVEAGNL